MQRATTEEIAALDWAAELDRRSWSYDHPPISEAQREADAERWAIEFEPRRDARPAGLVSLPTSATRTLSNVPGATRAVPPVPFSVRAGTRAVQEALGVFVPDPARAKLARLRRSVGASARCHGAHEVIYPKVVMVTLTYRGGNEAWQAKHVTEFVKRVREWLARRHLAMRYVWVAELQKRGVIHYHVALWLPEATVLPKPDEQGWWPHGMTRIETARHAVGYLMKYLSKGNEAACGSLPLGARSHGRGGLGERFREMLRWLSLPAFIKARASVADRWDRCKGGGWVECATGEIWGSEWQRVHVGNGWSMERVADHGRPFVVDGAFNWIGGRA